MKCPDERKVEAQDNVVRFDHQALQLPKIKGVSTLAGRKVEVRRRLDGSLDILAGKRGRRFSYPTG